MYAFIVKFFLFLPYKIFNDGQNLPVHMVKIHLSALIFDHLPRVLCGVS